MSSPKYATPLYLKRYPSRTLIIFLAMTHSGALVLLPWLTLPWGGTVCLSMGIALSFYLSWRRQAVLSSARAIVQIYWDGQGIWRLRQRDGIEWVGKLLPGYFVGPRLVMLNFVLGPRWRRAGVLFLPDNVDAKALRRLRVRLRTMR